MKLIQTDKSMRLLCVNGEVFLHHPAKIRSYHAKALCNEALSLVTQYASTVRSYSDMVHYIACHLLVDEVKAKAMIDKLLEQGFLQEINENQVEMKWHTNHWYEALQYHKHTNNLPKLMYNNKEGEGQDVHL
jgi:hypothetical protein